jgi:hypothetical protein
MRLFSSQEIVRLGRDSHTHASAKSRRGLWVPGRQTSELVGVTQSASAVSALG